MSKKIELLDCTLRDGAYIVNAEFGTPAIKGIIDKLEKANIDIIECGWLKNSAHKEGTSFYHVPDDFKNYLSKKNSNIMYTVMIDWDRYDLSYLPECDGQTIDAVRVVFPHEKFLQGIEVGLNIKKKGYKVFYQAANTLAYTDDELCQLADAINKAEPVSLSVVDTFGAMYEEDLQRIVGILDEKLDSSIRLGFHSHNNQQLSFALTIEFIKMLKDSQRDIIVDSSLCGMGRGAGNATTELVSSYLNRKCGSNYNLDSIMEAIDIYMSYFQEKYKWGYSIPYFIAGMYCCHVNNIAYLLENHRTSVKNMRNIIESLSPADRKKYDYDLLEQKYIENQSRGINDEVAAKKLYGEIKDRTILLMCPGRSVIEESARIKEYIAEHNAVLIGINAIIPGYDYDYVFFTNWARYDYAKINYKPQFDKAVKILLSSVKSSGEEDEYIIRYDNAVSAGWKYFDNAAICCLNLMDYLKIEKITICGFDGFKEKYNESYADPFLPSINPELGCDNLNNGIKALLKSFNSTAKYCKHIDFLTESPFSSHID